MSSQRAKLSALAFLVLLMGADGPRSARLYPPVPGKQLPSSYLPSVFQLHIGGLLGNSYSAEIKGDSLVYRSLVLDRATSKRKETSKVITPTAGQWRQFWRTMEEIRLWRWQREYPNPIMMDGTQWGLEVAFAGRKARSSGSNAYPGQVIARNTSVPELPASMTSEVFEKYLKAVETLLGGQPFR